MPIFRKKRHFQTRKLKQGRTLCLHFFVEKIHFRPAKTKAIKCCLNLSQCILSEVCTWKNHKNHTDGTIKVRVTAVKKGRTVSSRLSTCNDTSGWKAVLHPLAECRGTRENWSCFLGLARTPDLCNDRSSLSVRWSVSVCANGLLRKDKMPELLGKKGNLATYRSNESDVLRGVTCKRPLAYNLWHLSHGVLLNVFLSFYCVLLCEWPFYPWFYANVRIFLCFVKQDFHFSLHIFSDGH